MLARTHRHPSLILLWPPRLCHSIPFKEAISESTRCASTAIGRNINADENHVRKLQFEVCPPRFGGNGTQIRYQEGHDYSLRMTSKRTTEMLLLLNPSSSTIIEMRTTSWHLLEILAQLLFAANSIGIRLEALWCVELLEAATQWSHPRSILWKNG